MEMVRAVTDERDARVQRMWRSLRKETPAALGDADSHDDAEVAVMLRELGIALLEVEQPTQLVAGRLISIAKHYTHHTVRIVALPSALVVQVGSVAYESRGVEPLDHPAGPGGPHRRHRNHGDARCRRPAD